LSSGGGTLQLDEARTSNLVLTNTIGISSASITGVLSAGTNPTTTLELNGPIYSRGTVKLYNGTLGSGYVVFRGTNSFQSEVVLDRSGRLLIQKQANLLKDPFSATPTDTAPINFTDTSGYARLGLTSDSADDVTLNNLIFSSVNASSTNRAAAFILSTNSQGVAKTLRLTGDISGVGGVRLMSPGTHDMGNLHLLGANTYGGGTRISTGKIFVANNEALGTDANVLVGLDPSKTVGSVRFETRVDSYLVTTADIDFPVARSFVIDGDNTANIDTQSNNITIAGSIKNYDLSTSTNFPTDRGGHLRKIGAGNLTLSGSNSFTGYLRLSEGRVILATNPALPTNGKIQFGAAATLKLNSAETYQVGSISPVLIEAYDTNDTPPITTITERMNGTIDMGTNGVRLNVLSLPNWQANSVLTFTNLQATRSVYLPTNLSSGQLAQLKSAENPTYVASVATNGLLSFAPAGTSDTTPPVITVLGANPVTVAQGSVYSDAGASTDDSSAVTVNIPASITSTVGSKTVTYDSVDASGNNATQKTRTVNVTDQTVPVLALNGANPLSVSWGGAFTDPGASFTDNVDGSKTVTSLNTVDTSKLGSIILTYSAVDAGGNAAVNATRTVTVTLANGGTTVGTDGLSDLMRYALGGTSPSSNVELPTVAVTSTTLTMNALIRTNDSKVSVVGEYGLTPGTWLTNSPIAGAPSSIQTGVVPGVTQRQDFSVPRGTDSKKFMHLKATQAP
jgi:autotransporter-associated beta strand protein